MKKCIQLISTCLVLAALALAVVSAAVAEDRQAALQGRELLGRGMNLGNALDAPREGAWGITLREDFFDRIKEAGFQSVRIPIRWSAHTGNAPNYDIDAKFLERVDWAVEQSLKRKLVTIINVHHFEDRYRDPDGQKAQLISIWKQVAEHFRDRPDTLLFELLNEPNGKLTEERWNQLIPPLLRTIRASNPQRLVIVGPARWNNLNRLEDLSLPEDDRRIIATFHYYLPFEFTHQGASWVPNSNRWKGKTWTGTEQELAALQQDFQTVADWAQRHERPILLGEFGAFSGADMPSRARWTRAVTREAETHGFGWSYWEFASGFGAFDPEAQSWRKPLLDALMDKEP